MKAHDAVAGVDRSLAQGDRRELVQRDADGPRDASPDRPVPAVVYPHGGPTMSYADAWDGHAQYFVDRGFAWLALNFRG